MQVVSNSTPLIFLAKIGRLNLLKKLFKVVIIPKRVYIEVVVEGKEKGYNDAFIVEEFIEKGFILIEDLEIKKLKEMPIGRGEIEVIELAVKKGLQDVLIDESKGRRIARHYNLHPRGTLWVLTRAFEDDLISKDELKAGIQDLIRSGYRIKEEILVEIFRELF